jgi:hemolysin D
VENVAADANIPPADPRQQLQPAQTYKAYVRLAQQSLLSPSGEALKLNAGMSVVAEIHQGQRSVMAYLLSPVQKVRQEAGRER